MAIHEDSSRDIRRIWDEISAAGQCVIVLKPEDMARLHVDMFDEQPCPWACWGVSLLPVTPTSDALPRPQDPEILATRNPAEVAAAIKGHIAITFDARGLEEIRDAAASWVNLSEIPVHPYHPFSSPFRLVQVVNRLSLDRHPRSVESLTPHDMVRMMAKAASSLIVEPHRTRAGMPIATPMSLLFVEPPDAGQSAIEIRASAAAVHRLEAAVDGPSRSPLHLPAPVSLDQADPLKTCHEIATTAGLESTLGLFLNGMHRDRSRGRRPSLGARLTLAGLVPAWKGRRSIATALRLAYGRLSLDLNADGSLTLLGWIERCEHDAGTGPAHAALVPESHATTLQVDRLVSYTKLELESLEQIRSHLVELFVKEINPRLPAPYRLAFTDTDFGHADRAEWNATQQLIDDIVSADPELAAAAPVRYSVILPTDPAMGSTRIPRHGLLWSGPKKPSAAAIHRFLVLANAALIGVRSWGTEPVWNDDHEMALRTCGEIPAPAEFMSTATGPESAHAAMEASLRVARFWTAARPGLPLEEWARRLPDGLPLAAGTIAALDALYLDPAAPHTAA